MGSPPVPREPLFLGKGRFEAFSDGVFAIAITLLILEVRLPAGITGASAAREQVSALVGIWPQYLVYAASFATIGIMWVNHHALFDNVKRITHGIVVANLVLLGLIAFLPFTTEVLAQLGLSRPAVVYYGLTFFAISLGFNFLFQQVRAAHPEWPAPPFTWWNAVGLLAYPVATVAGYFAPIAGVGLIGLLAIFYLLPSNIRSVRVHS